jgi:hypothetical protein
MRNIYRFISILTFLLLAGSCTKEQSTELPGYKLKIKVVPMVNGIRLAKDVGQTNRWGEDFRIDVFRIYLGNFSLLDEGDIPVSDHQNEYYLCDVYDSASLTVDLKGNEKPFHRLRFQVGIDSIRNVSGAQTGVLDPLNGMFWTWQTGYIHAKFEGSSPASPRPDKRFTYHIGGFRQEHDTKRVILLDLPVQDNWTLDRSGSSEITMNMEIDAWFDAVHDLPIAGEAQLMQAGSLAVQYADNYARMFSLESIERK